VSRLGGEVYVAKHFSVEDKETLKGTFARSPIPHTRALTLLGQG
jgi:hypothetical protein